MAKLGSRLEMSGANFPAAHDGSALNNKGGTIKELRDSRGWAGECRDDSRIANARR
jgi:hypothetical protein